MIEIQSDPFVYVLNRYESEADVRSVIGPGNPIIRRFDHEFECVNNSSRTTLDPYNYSNMIIHNPDADLINSLALDVQSSINRLNVDTYDKNGFSIKSRRVNLYKNNELCNKSDLIVGLATTDSQLDSRSLLIRLTSLTDTEANFTNIQTGASENQETLISVTTAIENSFSDESSRIALGGLRVEFVYDNSEDIALRTREPKIITASSLEEVLSELTVNFQVAFSITQDFNTLFIQVRDALGSNLSDGKSAFSTNVSIKTFSYKAATLYNVPAITNFLDLKCDVVFSPDLSIFDAVAIDFNSFERVIQSGYNKTNRIGNNLYFFVKEIKHTVDLTSSKTTLILTPDKKYIKYFNSTGSILTSNTLGGLAIGN